MLLNFEGVLDKLKSYASDKSKAPTLTVGFWGGTNYQSGASVVDVAIWNEFGDPDSNRPPRPFFRGMIAKESGHWADDIKMHAKDCDYDWDKVFNQMGVDISGSLLDSINTFTEPALSPVTIAEKGFAKPLIDTGLMKNSITHKVEYE